MSVQGKIAIVTGAGTGIGAATSKRLAQAGAAVVLADLDEPAAAQVCAEITNGGGTAAACHVDITRMDTLERLFEFTAARFGKVRIMINNAGASAQHPFLKTTPDVLQRVLDVNVKGTFFCAQLAALMMADGGGGSIVNVSSHSALLGSSGRAAYAASKGAIVSMTRVMAVDLAEFSIRVNCIAPGPIEVPRRYKPAHNDERRRAWLTAVPLSRYGAPDEVASVALFLASDASSYMTGQTLAVDGGFSAAGLRVTL
ncbi:MAG TPA: glucose 1-dehydrogenase [Burkholderiales bacterium]|nr:glucose 1-dehydrogenase [Burkholderiales bacterium]